MHENWSDGRVYQKFVVTTASVLMVDNTYKTITTSNGVVAPVITLIHISYISRWNAVYIQYKFNILYKI